MNSEKEEFKPTREQLAQIKWQIIEAEKEEQAAADALKMAQQELHVLAYIENIKVLHVHAHVHTPSDHRCLYGTVTGVGGKFQNPFLRPGTPRRSLYGRYVRFFVIFETPRPRLRENPIFGVNATPRGVKQSNEFEPRANAPKSTDSAPGVT